MLKQFISTYREIFLSALITAWEAEGHSIGTDKYLQLQSLLKSLPESVDNQQLKTFIAPLMAQNPTQQDDFYQLFDRVLAETRVQNVAHEDRMDTEIQRQQRENIQNNLKAFLQNHRFAWSGLVALLAMVYWYFKPVYKDIQQDAYLRTLKTVAFALKQGDEVLNVDSKRHLAYITRTYPQKDSFYITYLPYGIGMDTLVCSVQRGLGRTEKFNILIGVFFRSQYFDMASLPENQPNSISDNANNTDNPQVKLKTFSDKNLLTDSIRAEKVNGHAVSGELSSWTFGFGNADFSIGKTLCLILLGIAVWLLGWYRRYRLQKWTFQLSSAIAPSDWTIRIPFMGQIAMDEKFYLAVSEMRQRETFGTSKVDVKKTIDATIAQAGMIDLQFQKWSALKNYLILIDTAAPLAHHAKIYDYIVQTLQTQEVPIVRFFFNSDMHKCWNENFPKGLTINEIQHRYFEHQVVIFSDGKSFLNPNATELADWTIALDGWKKKAILTSRPAADWDDREMLLSKKYRILPATTTGLAHLVENMEAIDPKSHLWWKEMPSVHNIEIPNHVTIESLYNILISHFNVDKKEPFDDRFVRWVAACALPPVPFWDWLLYVGDDLNQSNSPCLTIDNLFTISRLSWFRDGKMPEPIRGMLLSWLQKNHPYWFRELLTQWSWVLHLEENLPPVGSIAWQGHRVRVLLNELLRTQSAKQKRHLEAELNPLLTEETMKDALLIHYLEQNPSSTDKLLSNRFRKWVQEKRGILWEWRDWTWQVPTILSMSVLSLWIHQTAPVTTFQFGNYISSLSFSPDSKAFLVSNEVGDLGVCNDAKWLQGVETQQPIVSTSIANMDNLTLAAMTEKGHVMTWQIDKSVAQHSELAGRITSAVWSADMQKMLAGYYLDHDAKLWDVKTHRSVSFKSHKDAVISVALSADQSLVVTGSRDSTAKLWQATGEILQTFQGQNAVIQSVAISPDKTMVLTGGNNGKAILWDIRGTILHRFENQEYDVIGVHFSPDGKSLLTLSGEMAKLWSLKGQLLRTFEGHYATVVKAAFAPDQSKMLTGDDRGRVKLWQLGL